MPPFGSGPFGDLPFGGLPDVNTDPLVGFELGVEFGALGFEIDAAPLLNGFEIAVERGALAVTIFENEPLLGFEVAVELGTLRPQILAIFHVTASDAPTNSLAISDQPLETVGGSDSAAATIDLEEI